MLRCWVAFVVCLLVSCVVQHELGPLRRQGRARPFQGGSGEACVPGGPPPVSLLGSGSAQWLSWSHRPGSSCESV